VNADSPLWVGLDLGTQSARALVVGADGVVAGSGRRPLRSKRDGARHEQDPRQWWEAIAGACAEALATIAPERVAGVATCATSGTVLLVDEAGAPLTPALMYDDARATEQARRAGIGTGWGLPKLAWLLEEGSAHSRGARLAHQPDLVTRRLTGAAAPADESHALKTGWDAEHGRWRDDLLRALAIAPDVLPPVVPAGTLLGEVCAAAARESGLPRGTPVVAGMTDGCAAQLAAGALRDGAWNSVLGTTLVLKGASPLPIADAGGVLYCHRSPDGGWLPGGASSSGAGVLTQRFPGRDLDALDRAAQAHETSAPLAYPLLAHGERFPFHAPGAHGFMLGEPAGEGDHFAALLQGLAYVERLCLDYVSLLGAPVDGEVSLTGGATRSRYWCQLRADVLARPVRLPEHAESAFGMAVLAAAATTERRCADVAAEMCHTREVIAPRPDRAGRFTEPYLRLVGELERRGWLPGDVARHARMRATA
jgi:sugar (pentulose or hexulose) kinase